VLGYANVQSIRPMRKPAAPVRAALAFSTHTGLCSTETHSAEVWPWGCRLQLPVRAQAWAWMDGRVRACATHRLVERLACQGSALGVSEGGKHVRLGRVRAHHVDHRAEELQRRTHLPHPRLPL
jgi:hypothetical protein